MALTQITSAGLKDGEIVNADLHSSAAIALSKLGTSGTAGSGNYLRGDGAWTTIDLTALNASNLTSGTVAAARLDTATTQSAGNNSTKIATTAYADTAISNLVDSSPSALNTLNELAAALGDDANFSTTITNSIATKLPLAGGTLTGNLNLNDDVIAQFGASQDLKIYHDPNISYIWDSGSGGLQIRSNSLYLCTQSGAGYLEGTSGGSTSLFYDNKITAKTVPNGFRIDGDEGQYGYLYLYSDQGDDNADKWRIEVGNAGAWRLANYAGGGWENNIICHGNGGVELNHDGGAKKFETTNGGATVTGQLYVTAELNLINGSSNAAKYIDCGLGDNNALTIRGTSGGDANHETLAKFIRNGACEFYHDTAKKIETYNYGVKTEGHVWCSRDNDKAIFGVGSDLQIYHSGVNSVIDNNTGGLYIRNNVASDVGGDIFIQAKSGEDSAKFIHDGATELFYNGSKRFQTEGTGCAIIQGAGAYGLNISGSEDGKMKLSGANNPYIRFQEGSTDKAYVQWNSSGYLTLANQEDASQLRIRDDMDFSPDGSNFYTVWHSNNDGAGSALDAGKVSGHTLDWHNNYNLRVYSSASGSAGILGVDSGGNYMYQIYGSGGSQYGFLAGAWGSWDMKKNVGGDLHLNNSSNRVISQNDSPTFVNIYSSEWFRNNDSGQGLYNTATGQHFYSQHDDYWNIGGGGSANALLFRDDHGGTLRGYVYANNSSEIGFLNSSGNWSLRCDNSRHTYFSGNVYPATNGNLDLGSTGNRWNNLYVNDMHFSNEGKEGGNDVDGTTGDWTLQEGADTIFMINNKTGKKYKMALQEVS